MVYISVVGGGTLTVEDTTVYNDRVIQLRGDYGSSRKGDIGKDIYMGEKNENPMISIECIVIKNNNENIEFLLNDTEFFKDTEMIFE